MTIEMINPDARLEYPWRLTDDRAEQLLEWGLADAACEQCLAAKRIQPGHIACSYEAYRAEKHGGWTIVQIVSSKALMCRKPKGRTVHLYQVETGFGWPGILLIRKEMTIEQSTEVPFTFEGTLGWNKSQRYMLIIEHVGSFSMRSYEGPYRESLQKHGWGGYILRLNPQGRIVDNDPFQSIRKPKP